MKFDSKTQKAVRLLVWNEKECVHVDRWKWNEATQQNKKNNVIMLRCILVILCLNVL